MEIGDRPRFPIPRDRRFLQGNRGLSPISAETRFVRVTGEARGGFVEFQFAIGDPTLYLDMILPPAAFAEFCATNKAVHLGAEQGSMVDRDRRKWRGDPAE